LNVKVIFKEDIKTDLIRNCSKLHLRHIAKESGWCAPNYCLINFSYNDIQAISFPNIDISLLSTKILHLLLIKPAFIRKKVIRAFISKENSTSQITEFVNNIFNDLKKNSEVLFLLTEVIEPQISGISLYYDDYCFIEYGVGQMVAKGTTNLCQILLHKGKIIRRTDTIQEKSIVIKSTGKDIINYNAIPELKEALLIKIFLLSKNFYKKSKSFNSIEWIVDKNDKIWFIDATIEILNDFQIFINSSFINNEESTSIISPGECTGLVKIINRDCGEIESLDKHSLDEFNFTDIEEKYIYASERPFLSLSKYLPNALGFIFKEGSLLCHLSNQIRALGLPAIIDEEIFQSLQDGMKFNLNGNKITFINQKIINENSISTSKYINIISKTPISLVTYPKISTLKDESIIQFIGGKAANLNILKNLKYRIPKTIILSHLYLSKYGNKEVCDLISLHFSDFKKDPNFSLICRSSANIEDDFTNCLAGVFDSFGNLKNKADLLNALRQILKYEENKQLKTNYNLSPDQILMSVIIQEWLNPIIGGVLFTRSPNNFNNLDLLIEYELNGSDGVTSGIIKPYRLIIPRNEIIEYQLFRKRFKNSNFIKRIKLKVFFQFLKNCISLEEFLEYPLDIEFLIIRKGKIYFTQLRPISKRNAI